MWTSNIQIQHHDPSRRWRMSWSCRRWLGRRKGDQFQYSTSGSMTQWHTVCGHDHLRLSRVNSMIFLLLPLFGQWILTWEFGYSRKYSLGSAVHRLLRSGLFRMVNPTILATYQTLANLRLLPMAWSHAAPWSARWLLMRLDPAILSTQQRKGHPENRCLQWL